MSDFDFTITETSSMVDLEEYLNYLESAIDACRSTSIHFYYLLGSIGD